MFDEDGATFFESNQDLFKPSGDPNIYILGSENVLESMNFLGDANLVIGNNNQVRQGLFSRTATLGHSNDYQEIVMTNIVSKVDDAFIRKSFFGERSRVLLTPIIGIDNFSHFPKCPDYEARVLKQRGASSYDWDCLSAVNLEGRQVHEESSVIAYRFLYLNNSVSFKFRILVNFLNVVQDGLFDEVSIDHMEALIFRTPAELLNVSIDYMAGIYVYRDKPFTFSDVHIATADSDGRVVYGRSCVLEFLNKSDQYIRGDKSKTYSMQNDRCTIGNSWKGLVAMSTLLVGAPVTLATIFTHDINKIDKSSGRVDSWMHKLIFDFPNDSDRVIKDINAFEKLFKPSPLGGKFN